MFVAPKAVGVSSFTAIDLFAGCGGLTLGLELAGFLVLAAIECDEYAALTYESNHPHVLTITEDITTIAPSDLREALELAPGELDLIAGCPPCQGFSALRTRNGAIQNRDQRNGLVRELLRFVEEFLPRAVMMENVPGLSDKKAFRDLCAGLVALDYVVDAEVKDARFFGVAQRRRRLVLVAGRGFAIPLAKESPSRSVVRNVIGGLPPAGKSGDSLHDLGERRTAEIQRRISLIPKNGGNRLDLGEEEQLACHKNSDGFKDVYGRISWDHVAPTITSGCFNPSKGRFLHPDENRCITLREAALLQGFPYGYKFDVTAGKQRLALMIGNALPPEFIRRHALEVRKAITAEKGVATS